MIFSAISSISPATSMAQYWNLRCRSYGTQHYDHKDQRFLALNAGHKERMPFSLPHTDRRWLSSCHSVLPQWPSSFLPEPAPRVPSSGHPREPLQRSRIVSQVLESPGGRFFSSSIAILIPNFHIYYKYMPRPIPSSLAAREKYRFTPVFFTHYQ